MKNTKVTPFVEALLSSALCSLFAIISKYVPFISLPCSLLCGIPLMYVAYKYSLIYGALSLICAILCIGSLTADFISAILIMLSYGLPGMLFGICAYKKLRFSTSLTVASFSALLGVLAQLMIINGSGDGIELMFTEAAQGMTGIISSGLPKELIPANINTQSILDEAVVQSVNTIIYYMPSIMIIMSVVTSYLIIMLGIFLLKKFKAVNIEYISFNMIKMPKITVLMIIVTFLATDFFSTDNIYAAALNNIMIISVAAVGVSGFSYIDYKFSQRVKSGYVRALIYAGISAAGFMFVPFVAELSFILGVLDVFSKRRIPKVGGDDKIENKQK